jgi:V/A-type H+-transporting ATPase subunit A
MKCTTKSSKFRGARPKTARIPIRMSMQSKVSVRASVPKASMPQKAYLCRIAGPVGVAKGLDAKMYDVVLVGNEQLLGEVIQIAGEKTVIQIYEDTSGLKPGEPVVNTGKPLIVELGPGLLTSIYDGIQRPLPALKEQTGEFISRGARIPGLDQKRRWQFVATAKNGERLTGGQQLGYVEEVPGFRHYILVPPNAAGTLAGLKSGTYTVNDVIGRLIDTKEGSESKDGDENKGGSERSEGHIWQTDDGKAGERKLYLKQVWPVRVPRPVAEKLAPAEPLITGQRVMDVLFPIAKGGTAIVSGPFGAGKTVAQHQLAKWSDADIIVYVGCGERGNEMTEVLTQFPQLSDPRNGAPLMHRTILIANTSNMPVAAREASVYTGVTIAEYFRDMGYDVAMMADSTSRWAEALREISSRLEEMPSEEGYPAYLASRLAEFYERAALVRPLAPPADPVNASSVKPSATSSSGTGSLSIIGAVSPPGGDFFEPVTQSSLRVAKVFWALDAKIAQKRHFPSVNWLEAYSLYSKPLQEWYERNIGEDWAARVEKVNALLQEEAQLLEIVQLVGSDALPEAQQWTLHAARLIREGLLQQEAHDPLDTYCALKKSYSLVRLMTVYHEEGSKAIAAGAQLGALLELKLNERIFSHKFSREFEREGAELERTIREKIGEKIADAARQRSDPTALEAKR